MMKPSILTQYPILDLIPQRPPMVCVDALVELSEFEARSRFCIPSDHYFVRNGSFSAAGLLENVAQTCAARAGYLARELGQDVSLGFIASFKHVVCHAEPMVEQCIETHIQYKQTVFNMSIFLGAIFVDKKEILTCEIRIFVQA